MSVRRHLLSCLTAAALGAGAVTFATPAAAQSPDEINIARQTAGEGLQAYKDGNFEKALRLFEDAKAIYPSAQILRMIGYSQLGLERWEKAAEAMEAALASQVGPLSSGDREDVTQQLGKALSHLGTVNVTSSVQGAQLSVDGGAAQPLPLPKPLRLLEGKHTFVVTAEGHEDASREVQLPGGKTTDVTLDPKSLEKAAAPPKPPPPKPPPPKPPPSKGWIPHQRPIGMAAAGAGLLVGGAALGVALGGAHLRSTVEDDVAKHKASYGENCDRGDFRLCSYDREVINYDADRADGLRDASVGLFIGAGVLVAAGVVLVIFSPPGEAPPPQKGNAPRRPGGGGELACAPSVAGLTCLGAF